MATISGTSGSDTLNGTSANDTLNGLGGNDVLVASGGTDLYDGGAGSDTLDLRATTAGITLSFASGTLSGAFNGTFVSIERVLGGNGADSLIGAAGNQNLSARGGNDTLAGGAGVDTLWGGTGADRFVFRETGTANADGISDFTSGSDQIVLDASVMDALGASGNFAAGDVRFVANSSGAAQDASDRIIFNTTTGQILYDADGNGSGAAVLIATLQSGATLAATDIVVEGGGPAPIVGTDGNDSLTGTNGNDTIEGRGGNDTLHGGEGADALRGGDGNDVLWSNKPRDSFFQSTDGAADTLEGGLGDDQYHVDGTEDVILADPGGIDLVIAHGPNWTLGDGLDNLFLGIEASDGTGNALDNRIVSAWAGGTILGMGGNDELVARGSGLVTARGGDGDDTLLASVGGGANLLVGDAGKDLLVGHVGPVTMTGGSGADTFLYERDPAHRTAAEDLSITDFASGEDAIRLDGAAMPALGASGTLAPGDARFAANATGTAQDRSDRVVYNTTTGELWYDADGTGEEAAALLFTLQGAPTVAATDIEVVNGIAGWPVITGTDGDDTLTGTNRNDIIEGLGGNDLLSGLDGADSLTGGDGNDTLRGGNDRDDINGGTDTLDGGLGNDTYVIAFDNGYNLDGSSFGSLVLRDEGGVDTIVANSGRWVLGAGFENLVLEFDVDSDGSTRGIGNELDNVITGFQGWWAPSFIDGADGNDTLIGGGGDDRFAFTAGSGNIGHDQVDGGAGHDRLDYNGARSAVVVDFRAGTATGGGMNGTGSVAFVNIENAAGSSFEDLLIANDDGMWHRSSRGAFDDWFGGPVLSGRAGNDTLLGGASGDQLFGDISPLLFSPPVADGDDELHGGAGDDTLSGGGATDWLEGGAGNDVVWGDGGADSFVFRETGSANADSIVDFASGADRIVLDASVMTALGANGNFGAGDGRFAANSSGSAQDTSDRVIYNTATGDLWYDADGNGANASALVATLEGAPALTASDIEVVNGSSGGIVINGTAGPDTLTGTAGDDTINGLGGNDTLVGSGGNDFYDGGTGTDTLDLRATSAGVSVSYANGTISGGFTGTFVNIERVLGSDGADGLIGAAGAQTLSARGGNDIVAGGAGNDTLWGGGGADAFVFREMGTANADRISDFASVSDNVHLDQGAFTAIGEMGNFAAGDARFKANSSGTATDTNDRVVFNTSTGQLYYDADGSGSGAAAQLIATVQAGATVAATDIVVI